MLSFKTYLSDMPKLKQMGETARLLARKTSDPQGFILDFAAARFPHYYNPLMEAFYLEGPGDPDPEPDPSKHSSETPDQADNKNAPPTPASVVANNTGVLEFLKNLFGGGGAKSNFDKAAKALTRVDSVVRTVRIPPEDQLKGGPAEGYETFSTELKNVLSKMKDLGKQADLLNIADAIKKDPNYIQQLEKQLSTLIQQDSNPDLSNVPPVPTVPTA